MTIKIQDVLDMLVAQSMAPSTLGAQLERLRYGTSIASDPVRAREDAENRMLQDASVIRCVDAFAARADLGPEYKTLQKLTRFKGYAQGAFALAILRAYHEWSLQSEERGLVEIYQFLEAHVPDRIPTRPKEEDNLLQAFRESKAKRARSKAAEAYADSLLALGAHVAAWNKRA